MKLAQKTPTTHEMLRRGDGHSEPGLDQARRFLLVFEERLNHVFANIAGPNATHAGVHRPVNHVVHVSVFKLVRHAEQAYRDTVFDDLAHVIPGVNV